MVDIETIEKEILDLEKRDTTFATIERLAWLYTVKDHMLDNKKREKTGTFCGSEFCEACSDVPLDSLMEVLAEHFESIKMLYPKEYSAIIKKINSLGG